MAGGIEVEWQLICRDTAALGRWLARTRFPGGWRVTPAGVHRLADAYYDTADGHVARAGFALRVRRSGGTVQATLKALRRAAGGVARRREITSRVAGAGIARVRASAGAVGIRLRRIAGDRPLRRLFVVRTRRSVLALRDGDRVVAEIALDRTAIRAGERTRRLGRLEVEVVAGPVARVAGFVATLRRRRHLTFATTSKFEEGMRLARRAPAGRR